MAFFQFCCTVRALHRRCSHTPLEHPPHQALALLVPVDAGMLPQPRTRGISEAARKTKRPRARAPEPPHQVFHPLAHLLGALGEAHLAPPGQIKRPQLLRLILCWPCGATARALWGDGPWGRGLVIGGLAAGAALFEHQQGDEEREQREREYDEPVVHKSGQQERGKGDGGDGEYVWKLG